MLDRHVACGWCVRRQQAGRKCSSRCSASGGSAWSASHLWALTEEVGLVRQAHRHACNVKYPGGLGGIVEHAAVTAACALYMLVQAGMRRLTDELRGVLFGVVHPWLASICALRDARLSACGTVPVAHDARCNVRHTAQHQWLPVRHTMFIGATAYSQKVGLRPVHLM